MHVFVFPLVNVTLFPRTTKPLNIFENRYLEMVKKSIESNTPIVLGFIDDPNAVSVVKVGEKIGFINELAGYGHPQLIEERPNGTQLVFLHGLGKVKLGTVIESNTPYIVCEAEIVSENNNVSDDKRPLLEQLNKILVRWVTIHIPDPMQREVFIRNVVTPEEIVGAFSAYLIRDYDMQQMALEINDINEKIDFLCRLAESSETTSV